MKKVILLFLLIVLFTFTLVGCTISDGSGGTITVTPTEPVINITKLPSPNNVIVVDDIIHWSDVPNTDSYIVTINGSHSKNVGNALECSISSIVDIHMSAGEILECQITVTARGNQILYSDSDPSLPYMYTYTKKSTYNELAVPHFSYDEKENLITWDRVPNAVGYELKINDTSFTTAETKFTPPLDNSTEFTLKMRSISGENNNFKDSEWTILSTLTYRPFNNTEIDLSNNYGLGYGYNFLNDPYFDGEYLSINPILDMEKFYNAIGSNGLYADSKIGKIKSESNYAKNIEDFTKKISVLLTQSTNSSIDFGFTLTANVASSLNFSKNTSDYTESRFLWINSQFETGKYELRNYGLTKNLCEYFSDSFLSYINDVSISNKEKANFIIQHYGTHIILGVKTGGAFEYYLSYFTNDSSVSSRFDLIYSTSAGAKIEGLLEATKTFALDNEIQQSLAKNETTTSSNLKAYGFNPNELSIQDIIDGKWNSMTIDDGYSKSIGVTKNGIVGIGDIISYIDEDLGKEINRIIQEKATDEFKNLASLFAVGEAKPDGSEYNPYLISNVSDFVDICEKDNKGVYFRLTQDIMFINEIDQLDKFCGILDENGFSLINLSIKNKNSLINVQNPEDSTYYATGVIKENHGTIKNLTIKNLNINYKAKMSGKEYKTLLLGMVAYNANDGTVNNITIENSSITGVLQEMGDAVGYDSKLRLVIGCVVALNHGQVNYVSVRNSTCNGCTDGMNNCSYPSECMVGGVIGWNTGNVNNILSMNNTVIGKCRGGYGKTWFNNDGTLKLYVGGVLGFTNIETTIKHLVSLDNTYTFTNEPLTGDMTEVKTDCGTITGQLFTTGNGDIRDSYAVKSSVCWTIGNNENRHDLEVANKQILLSIIKEQWNHWVVNDDGSIEFEL